MGRNKKICYEIETIKALEVARHYRSFWTNRNGRVVAIVPVFVFKTLAVPGYIPEKEDTKQGSIFDIKPEKKYKWVFDNKNNVAQQVQV